MGKRLTVLGDSARLTVWSISVINCMCLKPSPHALYSQWDCTAVSQKAPRFLYGPSYKTIPFSSPFCCFALCVPIFLTVNIMIWISFSVNAMDCSSVRLTRTGPIQRLFLLKRGSILPPSLQRKAGLGQSCVPYTWKFDCNLFTSQGGDLMLCGWRVLRRWGGWRATYIISTLTDSLSLHPKK